MLLALLLAAAPTVADANAAGMKLYQAKRYPEAIEQFKAAIASSTDQPSKKEEVAQTRALALAHFNRGSASSKLATEVQSEARGPRSSGRGWSTER